jgi:hypothetical protein
VAMLPSSGERESHKLDGRENQFVGQRPDEDDMKKLCFNDQLESEVHS